ncbi:MAG TPA: YraN family protein [Candidatus Magasanikbacteria bacterium]|nr:YraN family protein [Candidatus Magasanikbacteria bacterium]
MRTQQIGRYGEDLAARFLIKQGFKILARNWRTRYGELDLVVRLGQVIHFVEVKTRTSLKTGEPEEAINHFKLRRLQLAAQSFLCAYKLGEPQCQFDSVAIVLNLKTETAKIRLKESIFF